MEGRWHRVLCGVTVATVQLPGPDSFHSRDETDQTESSWNPSCASWHPRDLLQEKGDTVS